MKPEIKFSRVWAMPNRETFSIRPIGDFVKRYIEGSQLSVDPFAGNSRLANWTNDLNPNTSATLHMDAATFLAQMFHQGHRFDLGILDMPYSPRQISEYYKAAGLTVGMRETQNARLYSETKDLLATVLTDDAIVLSFGWNTAGMGKKHGFEQIEIMICDHGGAHNSTLCVAEKRRLL